MAVCLVTGGAGFIGSHLVDALLARRDRVRVLDDFSSGSWSNLERVRSEIDLVAGDVNDWDTVRAAVEGADLVFHMASAMESTGAGSDPMPIHHSTATGTLHVLKAARDAQVARVVHSGSATVYQDDNDQPRQETDPTFPRSMYASAQLASEHYCQNFSRLHGLETVCLRYFHVFGPRQRLEGPHASVVGRYLERVKRGAGPIISGDGSQTRDYTYVEDVVQANLLAADAPRVAGKVFNIASGQATKLLDLIELLGKLSGVKFAPVHVAPQAGEPRHQVANIERAQTELGFCPCTDLPRDIRRCFGELASNYPIRSAPTESLAGVTAPDFRSDTSLASVPNPPHRWADRTYRKT